MECILYVLYSRIAVKEVRVDKLVTRAFFDTFHDAHDNKICNARIFNYATSTSSLNAAFDQVGELRKWTFLPFQTLPLLFLNIFFMWTR